MYESSKNTQGSYGSPIFALVTPEELPTLFEKPFWGRILKRKGHRYDLPRVLIYLDLPSAVPIADSAFKEFPWRIWDKVEWKIIQEKWTPEEAEVSRCKKAVWSFPFVCGLVPLVDSFQDQEARFQQRYGKDPALPASVPFPKVEGIPIGAGIHCLEGFLFELALRANAFRRGGIYKSKADRIAGLPRSILAGSSFRWPLSRCADPWKRGRALRQKAVKSSPSLVSLQAISVALEKLGPNAVPLAKAKGGCRTLDEFHGIGQRECTVPSLSSREED